MAEMTACEWLLCEREADIVDLPLQFNGFCGYTFVSRDGLLLPGTVPPLTSLGVIVARTLVALTSPSYRNYPDPYTNQPNSNLNCDAKTLRLNFNDVRTNQNGLLCKNEYFGTQHLGQQCHIRTHIERIYKLYINIRVK